MTLDEVTALSERLFAVAAYLEQGHFFNQAVARAYYGFYVLVDFTARRKPWPWPEDGFGRRLNHIPHAQIQDYVSRAFEDHGLVTTRSLQPPNAREAAAALRDQRLLADYKSHREMAPNIAAVLIRNCREIAGVVTAEARKVAGNAPNPAN